MDSPIVGTVESNQLNPSVTPTGKRGRPVGSHNLHSKQPSSIAFRLKTKGVDWVESFGKAIQRNDKQLLTIWLRLLPYLVVTAGHRSPKRLKGRASKAALQALQDLENG